jgi:hypothetical protein
MNIILLRGFSHSGKDFVGETLCTKYGYKRFAFADSLKKIVAQTFGCPVEQLHSQSGKLQVCPSDSAARTFRQILIDEALRLRNINPGVFVEHCCKDIIESDSKLVVITDWRYPNEIDIITKTFPNAIITPVHILRNGQDKSPVDDISEYQLQDRCTDYQIINNMDDTIYDEIALLIEFIELLNKQKEEMKFNVKTVYTGFYNLS